MIEYTEDWLFGLVFRRKGSVGGRAAVFAVPCMLVTLMFLIMEDIWPGSRKDLGLHDMDKSQLWAATTGVLGILLGFRTNRAMARFWEGTGLLHQMRGEWFDSVSCCVTFSRNAVSSKPEQVKEFRHTIVRLMSLCHGSALEEIAMDAPPELPTIDATGLDDDTLEHLSKSKEQYKFNRVEVLLHLIQSLITKGLADNILAIPPPILSRVYQTLSRGFVNLLNAKKISDTRFPFPYAQLIATLLLIHTIFTPLIISSLISSKIWAAMFTFVPTWGMYSLNFVAVELENPFGDDDNDLPLEHFQNEMNSCLLMLLHDNADHIPGVSQTRCVMDFATLQEQLAATTSTCRITRYGFDLWEEKLDKPVGRQRRLSLSSTSEELCKVAAPVSADASKADIHGVQVPAEQHHAIAQPAQVSELMTPPKPTPVMDSLVDPKSPVAEQRIAAAVTLAMEARIDNPIDLWPKSKRKEAGSKPYSEPTSTPRSAARGDTAAISTSPCLIMTTPHNAPGGSVDEGNPLVQASVITQHFQVFSNPPAS